ncbi:hypothetical protein ZWY2020_056197, partial [Hordeum vulgare]
IRWGSFCSTGEPQSLVEALEVQKLHEESEEGWQGRLLQECPYELAMATMTQGMDMAIMLSQLGSQKLEL